MTERQFGKISTNSAYHIIASKQQQRIMIIVIVAVAMMVTLPLARGISLIRKSIRDFSRTKGFLQIFDRFFLKTKDLRKGARDFREWNAPRALVLA